MPDYTTCGAYTKFEGWLYPNCYKEKHNATANAAEPEEGLSEREKNYRHNMIKGRIAETLIQELFLSLKYNVFRYGMENTIPGIMELLKSVKSEVAEEIKHMPDFVVQHSKASFS